MTHDKIIIGAIVLIVASMAAGGRAQTPPAGQAVATKPGRVTGVITSAENGKPLRRARVTLNPVIRTSGTQEIAASTNSRGQYEAKEVPPGSYYVSAERAGYLRLQHGQRRPGEDGISVEVGSGETVEHVDVALPRGAVLAGAVTDETGQPYPGVRVNALLLQYYKGQRQPSPMGAATSDDLGQFRISGLQPGRYVLVASSIETWRTERGDVFGYASTYYPGGQIDQAVAITLAASEVKPDLNIPLQAGRTARISGRLRRETGEATAAAGVSMAYSYPGVIVVAGIRNVTTEADGSFEFKNVTGGHYEVMAAGGASSIVDVQGADIDGIELVSRTGSTVTGRVTTDEGAPPPFPSTGVRILLEAPSDDVLPTVRVVSVDSDWSFKLTGLGGHFLFRVIGIPDDWMLSAVRLDDADITDRPWDVPTGGKTIEGLQVTLTRKVGRVVGAVVDADGKATSDAAVVLFCEDRDLWIPASRLVRVARPDANGRFSIAGLPGGDYRVSVHKFVENGQSEDRSFLEAAMDGAVRVVLAEGGTETVSLKLPAPPR